MLALPEAFKQNILSLYPNEAGYFFDALCQPPCSSVRLNNLKQCMAFADQEVVEWCSHGRYLTNRPSFIEDPLFHAGAYYVQESSSMFLDYLVKQLISEDSPLVLDLCAAPGGKSTLLAGAIPERALLVSNEIIKGRVGVLQENMIKWGNSNVVVTNNDPKQFKKTGVMFDLILVDAPCSGEGLWRREPEAMQEWSSENVKLCSSRQERILQDILPCLKPGGILIYATCTFNRNENEDQILRLITEQGMQPKRIEIPTDWPVKTEDNFQFRFLPHLVKGEGLFIGLLQKPMEESSTMRHPKRTALNFVPKKLLPQLHPWLENPLYFDYFIENEFIYAFPVHLISVFEIIRSQLYIRHAGICMGKTDKEGKLIPDHSLAMSVHLNKNIPKSELNKVEALKYLKKGTPALPEGLNKGWYLAAYEGLGLGWMKVLPGRVNNYFPAEYRILKDIAET